MKKSEIAAAVIGGALLIVGIGTALAPDASNPDNMATATSAPIDNGVEGAANEEDYTNVESPWEVQTTADRMSDQTVAQATQLLEGEQFKAEVTIKCVGGSALSYEISTFNKEGAPEPLRAGVKFDQGSFFREPSMKVYSAFEVRFDKGRAEQGAAELARYTNEILWRGSRRGGVADQAATARHVDLRVLLKSGEEVFSWDQSTSDVRTVLDPCIQARSDAIAREAQAREAETQRTAETEQVTNEAAPDPVGEGN